MKNITNVQLRSARQILNLGVRDIARLLKVSKATISKAELGKTRDFFFKNSAALRDYFEAHKIIFPNEYTIRIIPADTQEALSNDIDYLNRFQLKGSRCLLQLSQQMLACKAGIDRNIISRAELLNNSKKITSSNKEAISQIKLVFNNHNIELPEPYLIFFKKYIDNPSNG